MIDNNDIQEILKEQPDITEEDLLVRLKTIETEKSRMLSPDMMVHMLTMSDSITSLFESTDEKAKGFLLAIKSGGITEFNLMDSHPIGQLQQKTLTHLVEVNAVTPMFKTLCLNYANYSGLKYPSLTIEQLRAVLRPSQFTPTQVLRPVIIDEAEVLPFGTNSGAFRFTIQSAETFRGSVNIKLFASKDGKKFTRFPQYDFQIQQDFEEGVYTSFIQKRSSGLSGFKYFKFEHCEPWDGAIIGVEVEGVN